MQTLLVVDDEPSVLETTRFILESEGYHVVTASNGLDALALAREHRPRVVLLDVMLPKLDGYGVCKALREDPGLAPLHVIILTARGQRSDELRAREAGADAYLRKPFDDTEILARIAAVFAGDAP